MGRRTAGLAAIPLVWLSSLAVAPPGAAAADGVVRALLFSSPTCPHCRKVREEVLPALWDQYGSSFQVAVVSTATPDGRDLYWAAVSRYGIRQRGVPLLVVGDFVLVGSEEIPRRLPTLVMSYLGSGGVDWPPLPGLDEVLAASNPAPAPPPTPIPAPVPPEPTPAAETPVTAFRADADATPAPAAVPVRQEPAPSPTPAVQGSPGRAAPAAPSPAPPAPAPMLVAPGTDEEAHGVVARVLADPQGNGLAILVLVGMLATVVRSITVLRRRAATKRTRPLDWLTPLLGLAGFGVASYLAHVEVQEIEAVCGPVGDCNTVQQSEYARLFGVFPIGVLGVLGFAAILLAWAVRRWGAGRASSWAAIALLAMTGVGVLFSIYLTFLEPFVIGATCLWCLSSAVIMTALYAHAHAPGRAAAAELGLRHPSGGSRPAP
jgi:uncharacterized membrane protein